jgi:hypothetical protein
MRLKPLFYIKLVLCVSVFLTDSMNGARLILNRAGQDGPSQTKDMFQLWKRSSDRDGRKIQITRRPQQSPESKLSANQKNSQAQSHQETPDIYKASEMSDDFPEYGQDIGITVWRLRLPSDNKKEVRQEIGVKRLPQRVPDAYGKLQVIPQTSNNTAFLIAERASVDELFRNEEMIQLGVEIPSEGYLYIFEREKYADGTTSTPFLIFPTARNNGGKNKVGPGVLTYIPALTDDPPIFTLKRSVSNQVAEELTFFLTPEPLSNFVLPNDQLEWSEEQFKGIKQWTAKTGRADLVGGNGKVQVSEEAEAAKASISDRTKRLKHSSPLPQTIFRVVRKPSEPFIVTMLLRIAP